MAGTELGTAYVQVIPSAEGIKGSVTKLLGGEADSAGESAGKRLAGKLKGVLAAAGIGAALTKAVTEGAALEQSVGGIETLFKSSSQKMIQNANEAFRTAGLSANEYMETATGFSASLLQSLGGDTEKAAKYADMAIKDMGDNANKMGTDMGSIQYAYQGFAKQNYTMLDNLKLGYGGTQEEMKRLLEDASRLSGQKYDISSLSDVYEAIHVVQQELDITGTTSKEAASTIAGSFASMKSAGTNVLGAIVTGMNVEGAMKGLVTSVTTFVAGNLIPALANVAVNIPKALVSGISASIPAVKAGFKAGLKKIFGEDATYASAKTQMLAGMRGILNKTFNFLGGSGIGTKIPAFMNKLTKKFQDNFPKIANTGIKMARNFLDGVMKKLPDVITSFSKILASVIKTISSNLPLILAKGVTLVAKLAAGIIKNLPAIAAAALKAVGTLNKAIVGALPTILAAGGKMISSLASGMLSNIAGKLSGVVSRIKDAFSFRLSLPHVALPHFSISPPGWSMGDLLKGSIPSLGVSWYAKGGVFDGPSVVGVGEAGREAVVPLTGDRMKPFADAIADAMGGAGQNYNFGDIVIPMDDLKNLATIDDLISLIRRAKKFA